MSLVTYVTLIDCCYIHPFAGVLLDSDKSWLTQVTYETVDCFFTSTCAFVLVEEKSFTTAADEGLSTSCLVTHLLAGSFSTPVHVWGERKALSANEANTSVQIYIVCSYSTAPWHWMILLLL